MSEITNTFSLEYETGSKTETLPSDVPATEPVIRKTGTEQLANAPTSGILATGTEPTANVATSGILEAGTDPAANVPAYDIAKPRRIVTRGRIEHEPQS